MSNAIKQVGNDYFIVRSFAKDELMEFPPEIRVGLAEAFRWLANYYEQRDFLILTILKEMD